MLVLALVPSLSATSPSPNPKEEEGVGLGPENLSAEESRGHSRCPGALQANRAPQDPAMTWCIEPGQGLDLRGRQHSDRPVTTYIDVALSKIAMGCGTQPAPVDEMAERP